MAVFTHQGMGTYSRLLQDARANKQPIGPQHHLHNRQLKKWAAKEKNRAQLAKAREAKVHKAQATKAKKSIQGALEKIKNKQIAVTEQDRLLERYNQLNREKLAAAYKVEERGLVAKSAGNGL